MTPILMIIMVALVAAAGLLFWAHFEYDPFFGSSLRLVSRSKTRDGRTIYIFKWRSDQKLNKSSECDPSSIMRKCGVAFANEGEMKDLNEDKGLPRGISISSRISEESVMTIHVSLGGSCDLEEAKELPRTAFDYYAGVKERSIKMKTETRELAPLVET